MKVFNEIAANLRPAIMSMAAASVAVALSGCSEAGGKPVAAAASPTPVSVATVVEQRVAEAQEFSGRLEAIERVQIRPRVAGYITAVNFKPGALVKKDDVLYVIDPRPFQAEADRAAAAASAASAKADLAHLELERAARLLGDKAIAQREYDERAADSKELGAAARAAAAQAEAARLNLSYTRVLAPIDGRVGKDEYTVGNLVDAASVLTSVVSLKRIYASFDGDEQTYLRVSRQAARSQPVTVGVGLADEEGFPHQGHLEFVDNQLDTRTGSVRLRAVLDNDDGSLAPGLFARVQVGAGELHPAILINDRAVGTDQSHKFVYVVHDDAGPERREVMLGPVINGLRVVRSGLRPGDKIVVNGLQRVRPGARLKPDLVPMSEPAGGERAVVDAKG